MPGLQNPVPACCWSVAGWLLYLVLGLFQPAAAAAMALQPQAHHLHACTPCYPGIAFNKQSQLQSKVTAAMLSIIAAPALPTGTPKRPTPGSGAAPMSLELRSPNVLTLLQSPLQFAGELPFCILC